MIVRAPSSRWAVVAISILLMAACGDDNGNGNGNGDGSGSGNGGPAELVDLQPVDMQFELSGEPAPLTHVFVLEVRNNEPGTSPTFDVDCEYDNGGTVGGIDAVTAGVLNGNSSMTYRQLTSVQGPSPSNASVRCVVDPDSAVAETNEGNNVLEFDVSIP